MAAEKKPQRQCAVKQHVLKREGPLKFGDREHKLDHFCISMNVLRPNIGSEEMIAINAFAQMAIDISGKDLSIYNIDGDEFEKKYGHKCPIGVNGRNSDNNLYLEKIGWVVSQPLIKGMRETYRWIKQQVDAENK